MWEEVAHFQDIVQLGDAIRQDLVGHVVDLAEQVNTFDDRQNPPQLGALAKHGTDVLNVVDTVFVGNESGYLDLAGGWHQDAGQHF